MKSFIKQTLFGNELPQEYVCVPWSLSKSARLILKGQQEEDLTEQHVFLGYKPLIFGFQKDPGEEKIHLQIRENGFVLAELAMKNIASFNELVLYEGVAVKLLLISKWRSSFLELRERVKDKGPSNIELPRSLYKQVIAAYCIPRSIALFVVRKNGSGNIFPTDLHGPVGRKQYTSSLRISGKACAQIMEAEEILLCNMPLGEFKVVYDMGKNHMCEMKPERKWTGLAETEFGLIPKGTTAIRRLKILDQIDIGIHRIFSYSSVEEKNSTAEIAGLGHCHREYLQWRIRNRLPIDIRLR